MASKAAYKRLSKEYVAMQKEPPPFVWAAPEEKNILSWNFIIHGPPDSPFAGGEYHGILLFPSEYPFKPPGIKMFTPSGRFQPDKKICFSMSDFHPGTWNPAWSVQTILTGLVSFMLSDEMTTGSMTTSDADKHAYAARSHAWNIEQKRFKEAFPEYCTPSPRALPNMGEKDHGKPDTPAPAPISPATSTSSQSQAERLSQPSAAAVSVPTVAGAVPGPVLKNAANAVRPRKIVTPRANGTLASNSGTGASNGDSSGSGGWLAAWRQLVWEKWRWGVLIALAVVVSRLTSGA